MPLILLVLAGLVGVGYFAHEELAEPAAASVASTVAPSSVSRMGPSRAAWVDACRARLVEAGHEFEVGEATGCQSGEVTVSQLPSGVDYVEYNFHSADGATYQVTVTEEPQDADETPGWRGAPGCHGFERGFEVVRHENGRLARIAASAGRGMEFAHAFESVTDECVDKN